MNDRARLGLALSLGVLACEREAAEPSPTSGEAEPATVAEVAPAPTSSSAPTVATPTKPPPVPAHGLTIVKPGARLRIDPAAAEPSLDVPALVAGQAGGYVFAAAGRTGELVTVESVASTRTRGCERVPWSLSDFRLVFHASESDLVPVTTRRLDVAYADGTRVIVLPGVTVVRAGADGEVDAGGLVLQLAVPQDAVGPFYEPDEAGFAKLARTKLSEAGAALVYGEGKTIADEKQLDSDFVDGARLPVGFGKHDKDGKSLVEVRNRCAAVTAIAAPERFEVPFEKMAGIFGIMGESGEAGLFGVLGSAGPTETVFDVKRGAAITWEDGRAAGQVVSDHTFDRPPVDAAGSSCFALEVEKDSLTLCFAASDVQRRERPKAELGGFGGLVGTEIGEGGTGTGTLGGGGFGRIGMGSDTSGPKIKMGAADIDTGGLGKDVIRRIIRRKMGAIRFCYEAELAKSPELAGKITIEFTIGESGSVTKAKAVDDTMGSKDVAACIVKAVEALEFPKPTGGSVNVRYPFTFVAA